MSRRAASFSSQIAVGWKVPSWRPTPPSRLMPTMASATTRLPSTAWMAAELATTSRRRARWLFRMPRMVCMSALRAVVSIALTWCSSPCGALAAFPLAPYTSVPGGSAILSSPTGYIVARGADSCLPAGWGEAPGQQPLSAVAGHVGGVAVVALVDPRLPGGVLAQQHRGEQGVGGVVVHRGGQRRHRHRGGLGQRDRHGGVAAFGQQAGHVIPADVERALVAPGPPGVVAPEQPAERHDAAQHQLVAAAHLRTGADGDQAARTRAVHG